MRTTSTALGFDIGFFSMADVTSIYATVTSGQGGGGGGGTGSSALTSFVY
jgi:hypothetical protein